MLANKLGSGYTIRTVGRYLNMTIGDRIKNRRLRLNMTLEDVAQRVGITRQTVQKYESGVVVNIPSDKIESLAVALQTTPSYLMGWSEKQQIDEIFDRLSKISDLLSSNNCKHPDTLMREKIELNDQLSRLMARNELLNELSENEKPTPVSESGPINPKAKKLIDMVMQMDDTQLDALEAILDSVIRLRGQ